MSFSKLDLVQPLQKAVAKEGYALPTPIQERSIPHVLAGRDLLGCAQTGTGKTAAFALPIVQRLAARNGQARIRALVLSPTRELAAQIGDHFGTFGRSVGVRHAVVYGGVSQNAQARSLRPAPDVLVATPGRLLDLCSQRLVALDGVEILVLDEADRMLDMGFIHDVRKIVAMVPRERQTLMFSATMPSDIEALGRNILTDPVRVTVAPTSSVADTIEQFVYFVAKQSKRALLEHVLEDASIRRALVFTRTKHGAERLAAQLVRARFAAGAIHGNKSQGQRQRALDGFRYGKIRVLVATDVAARGLDVDDVTHVINFDLPDSAESYVHRIGRTGRAGALGTALSFCDAAERSLLRDVEQLIRIRIPVVQEHPYLGAAPPQPANAAKDHPARTKVVSGDRTPRMHAARKNSPRPKKKVWKDDVASSARTPRFDGGAERAPRHGETTDNERAPRTNGAAHGDRPLKNQTGGRPPRPADAGGAARPKPSRRQRWQRRERRAGM